MHMHIDNELNLVINYYHSKHSQAIGWLSVHLLTQHCTLCDMLDLYINQGNGISLNPPSNLDAIPLITLDVLLILL